MLPNISRSKNLQNLVYYISRDLYSNKYGILKADLDSLANRDFKIINKIFVENMLSERTQEVTVGYKLQ